MKINRAIVSVSNKDGLKDLIAALVEENVEIISSGGTHKHIVELGFQAIDISEFTDHPEMMNGRVKTLHPKVHAGILANRDEHMNELESMSYLPIDLIVVNLYPFAETLKSGKEFSEVIENIDIGGPTMIRAAAKNFKDVLVLSDPSQYEEFLSRKMEKTIDIDFRKRCAARVFELMSQYDNLIAGYLSDNEKTNFIGTEHFKSPLQLRYGENPHQNAELFQYSYLSTKQVANADIIQGKALSFNNMVDADAAWQCVKSFQAPACVIVKHANPCGVACSDNSAEAYAKAFQTDPTSAFGGVISFNANVDHECVKKIIDNQFVEIILAPDFSDEALSLISTKPNVRVLKLDLEEEKPYPIDLKMISGGILIQDADQKMISIDEVEIVTKLKPSNEELNDLLFAWKVAKYVKSNAIVFAKNFQTIGVGAGQMSRVISTEIAAMKAKEFNLEANGAAMASDAFFPFRDGIDQAASVGIKTIIQPGGSMRDDEVIEAANEHGMAMVFTGVRHFRH